MKGENFSKRVLYGDALAPGHGHDGGAGAVEAIVGLGPVFAVGDDVGHFVFVAGDDEFGLDTFEEAQGGWGPAVGEEDVHFVLLVERVDPREVVVVGLVAGLEEVEAFGSADEIAIVDDVLALVAGEGDVAQVAGDEPGGNGAGWRLEEFVVDRIVAPDVFRADDGLLAGEEEIGHGAIRVVVVPMADEKSVCGVGELGEGFVGHRKGFDARWAGYEIVDEGRAGGADEEGVVVELPDAGTGGGFGGGDVFRRSSHTLAEPGLDEGFVGGAFDVEDVVEADEGGAADGMLGFGGWVLTKHVVDPLEGTVDEFVGGVL